MGERSVDVDARNRLEAPVLQIRQGTFKERTLTVARLLAVL